MPNQKVKIVCPACQNVMQLEITDRLPARFQVACTKCKVQSPFSLEELKGSLMQESRTEIEVPQELGWLIVHDEHTPSQSYSLKLGNNLIGRKSELKPSDWMIETNDKFMSRNHCIIQVNWQNERLLYTLKDAGSTNRTYLNANPKGLNPQDEVYLQNGDTIQIGRTKVVLKLPSQYTPDLGVARNQVGNSPHSNTVII